MKGLMLPSGKLRIVLFGLAVACVVPSLSAVIVELRMYHGKQIQCLHSGLGLHSPTGRICGTYGFARVFTGTVKSVTAISDTDRRLELIPEKTFLGPASEVTATVNQACMPLDEPEIQAGDKWLFYLQSPWRPGQNEQEQQGELVLPYDSRSGPLDSTSTQEEILTLRHLARLTDSGVVTGRVIRMEEAAEKIKSVPIPDWALTAKSVSSGIEYKAVTDSNGHFEFELPADSYSVTANTQRGSWSPDADPFVRKTGCSEVDFSLHADGELSGTVTTADGKPAAKIQVAILRESPWPEYFTVQTDERGHFEVRGQDSGRYIVGEGVLALTVNKEFPLRVYYPGVSSRDHAKPIDLGQGEWRTDIDFSLPATK
jgi:hypothetical protein